MVALCCFVLLLFHSVSSELTWETPHTINWIASDALPKPIIDSVQLYYDDHFIMFGGHIEGPSSSQYNELVYIGTPSPTTNTFSWRSNHSLEEGFVQWEYGSAPFFNSQSQCHSTNRIGTFFMKASQPRCYEDLFLFEFNPGSLIYSDTLVFDRYNLTKFYYNHTYDTLYKCKYSEKEVNPCIATNSDNFEETQTVYIVLSNRIFVYNISSDEGYFSDEFTYQDQLCYINDNNEWECGGYRTDLPYDIYQPSCSFDSTGKYIWITEDSSNLWRYDVDTMELIDVSAKTVNRSTGQPMINGTLNKLQEEDYGRVDPFFYYSTDTQRARMIPLTDGFIMVTGDRRDYIVLPNVTGAEGSYAESNTEYIDVVCAGRYHDENLDWAVKNTPLFIGDYPTYDVVSFGGYRYYDVEMEPSICEKCNGDGTDRIDLYAVYNASMSKQIRRYAWLRDFTLVINFTEQIQFGDDIELDVYFEPSCDLSGYYYNKAAHLTRDWIATEYNPLLFEIYIEASELSLGIQSYMYIINATTIEDREGWDTTYAACYLCKEQQELFDTDWNNEETVLSSDVGCVLCEDGLPTGSVQESQAGTLYELEFEILQSPNNSFFTLESNIRSFTMEKCSSGYGTTPGAKTIDCNECPFNQFSLQETLDACIACDTGSEGIACNSGDFVEITYNYWVAAWDFNDKDFKPFYEIEEYDDDDGQQDDLIVTSLCPPKYCCQDVSGCDYLPEYLHRPQKLVEYWGDGEFDKNGSWTCYTGHYYQDQNGSTVWYEYDEEEKEGRCGTYIEWIINWTTVDDYQEVDIAANGLLCAFGRDVDVPLCGACLDGWAELLGTTQCGDCEDSSGWQAIVVPAFIFTMVLSWYIIFCDSKPIDFKILETKKQLMIQDDITGFQTLLFKPVLYYFQSINPILDTRGIKLWISPVVAFFNFSFDTISDQDYEICWSPHLDACGEILINLLLPVLLMVQLLVPRCCVNREGYGSFPLCCCCKQRKICCCCCKNFQTPYYTSAFFRVLLISIGVVLTVCFKYLTYVQIEDTKRLFYSADKHAFNGWWFGGFWGVVFVIVVFIVIFIKIKKQPSTQRYSTNSIYRKFVKSFKEEYWYWEFVLFSRRFFISCFTSIQFVGGGYTNFIFLVILLIYLVLNVHYKPFAYSRVNKIETLCLVLLVSAFAAATFIDIDDDDLFVGWMLSICILIPLIIIAFYGLKIVLHRCKWVVCFDEDNKLVNKKIETVLQRMPKSFRDLANKEIIGSAEVELGDVITAELQPPQHEVNDVSDDFQDINTNNPVEVNTNTEPVDTAAETEKKVAEAEIDVVMKGEGDVTNV